MEAGENMFLENRLTMIMRNFFDQIYKLLLPVSNLGSTQREVL